MAIFHWSILLYAIYITMTMKERITIQILPKTVLKTEIIHKWLKIFDFTDYSKDWEQIILGSSPETRQWKGKTVKLVSIFTSQLQSHQNHCENVTPFARFNKVNIKCSVCLPQALVEHRPTY